MTRRKSSSTKRLSPAPSTQTSYYSESVMSESYLGGSRGLAALGSSMLDDALDSSTYWGEPSLSLSLPPVHGSWGPPWALRVGWCWGSPSLADWVAPPCGGGGWFLKGTLFWGQVGSSPPGGEEGQGTQSPVRLMGYWRARRTTPTPPHLGTPRKTTMAVGMHQPLCGGRGAGGDWGDQPGAWLCPGCCQAPLLHATPHPKPSPSTMRRDAGSAW